MKEAGTAYVELVAHQRRTQGELTDNFVAMARRSILRELAASTRISEHTAMIRAIRLGDTEVLKISWKGVLSTRNNLSFTVLLEVLETLGLDAKPYSTMAKPVIDALVKRRNGIAHGEGLPVSEEDFQQFHHGTIRLLDTYRDQLSEAAAKRQYLAVMEQRSS